MWREEFLASGNPPNPETYPFIVVANKADLDQSRRQVTKEEGEKFAQTQFERPLEFIETSAKENNNITEAFEYIIRSALSRSHLKPYGDEIFLEAINLFLR